MKLYEQVFYFISGHGRGWAFSSSDLMRRFSRQEADSSLSYLAGKGKIRRVCRGIYDYPEYSEILKQVLSPDIDQVARAFARKFNWRIQISGDSALNQLGLSAQVVGKHIYLSDGESRTYRINGTTLEFKKTVLKDVGFKHKESSMIVQALKALGENRITPKIISKIRERIEPNMYGRILKDTQSSTTWIYETIKKICRDK